MTMKEKVKELWKLCFDDSDEFIELYFQLRYSNKVNISIQSGDDVIAALQMIPYSMTFYNSEINTSYISGACTHPDYRDRGVMRELLSQSFTQMVRRGTHISTLIPAEPWLFDYYKKIGYAPVFNYTERELYIQESNQPEMCEVRIVNSFDETVYSFFEKKMHERSCCIQHDRDDYKVILDDLKLSGGSVFTAWSKNKIIAMAFIRMQDNSFQVTEILSDQQEAQEAILEKAATHYGVNKFDLILPPEEMNNKPLGMARIIHAKAVLQLYALANPDLEVNIELTDNQLSLNNGYYYLVDGKCMITKKRLPGRHLQLTISELTQYVFASEQAYMSLMLD